MCRGSEVVLVRSRDRLQCIMRNDLPLRTAVHAERLLVAILLAVAVYIVATIGRMPPIAASHFMASGAANGLMTRGRYLAVMLVSAVGLPAFIGFVPARALNGPTPRVNLPNRDYWFAPERRDGSVAALKAYLARVGAGLAVFMAYVHRLVLRANALHPPHLDSSALVVGIAVFLTWMLLLSTVLVRRFSGGAER